MKKYHLNRRDFIRMGTAGIAATTLPFSLNAQETMLTRTIPSTGENLPVMGLGNSQAFRDGDLETSRQVVDILVEMGGKLIDTRGVSTVTLGKLMPDLRTELFLANNITADDKKAGLEQVNQAKIAQGKELLDLVQINRFNNLGTAWNNLRELKDAGHTKYIGVAIAQSSVYGELETLMNTGTMDFVQLNYSMLEPQSGERLLPLAQDKGIAVITNRPFVNGNYFGHVRGHELPEWVTEFDCNSWAQFSLKWILSNPAVNCILTETANPKHARDNLGAGFGSLPDNTQRKRMLDLIRSL